MLIREKAVSFSGYRSEKLPHEGVAGANSMEALQAVLRSAVEELATSGYEWFLVGMADGFDTLAAQAVISVQENHPHIQLVAVLPYEDGRKHTAVYTEILAACSETLIISEKVHKGTYFVRNEYMVDHSSFLVCYYDGRYGGTEYTVEYAQKKNVTVRNLWLEIAHELRTPKMLDNKWNGRVIEELTANLKKGSRMSVISAYFTIYAYAELKRELSRLDNFQFIFTEPTYINRDSTLIREYYLDHPETSELAGNDFEIKLRNEMKQASIAKECAKWLEKKVEMRSLKRPNPAQPRLVYIENKGTAGRSDFEECICINGTVDFTTDGLGVSKSDRIDSNMCVYGKDFTAHFLKMFQELWNDPNAVEDVKDKVLEHMKVLYKENTPEFIYFVTLYHIFEQYLDELTDDTIVKTKTGIQETMVWNKLYKFQQDGVMGIIDKMEKHNGCILADSVGLGKTFTALAVIKYYELRNYRVLVLAPKKLRENWSIYTLNDKRNLFLEDRFQYQVLNHTDLGREQGYSGEINLSTIYWANYDLIVIDESHNFRNNNQVKDRTTRYERLLNEVIKSGVKTKVLMLSATPVNNRMNDIKNQIAFITEGKADAFAGIGLQNVEQILRKAQLTFNRWQTLPDNKRTTEAFVEMMDLDYFKLLDTLTIARSRKHIERYYNLAEIGKFPERMSPRNVYAEIDLKSEFPTIEEINGQIKQLNLCVYAPLAYVRPEKRKYYSEKYDAKVGDGVFTQMDREKSLVNLMRVNILKRMESSIHAFTLTVGKILGQITKLLEMIENYSPELSPASLFETMDIEEDEDADVPTVGNNVKVKLADIDLLKWRQDLWWDMEQLQAILNSAKKVTAERDAKLSALRDILLEKQKHPINPGNRKVIIFSAFADTAKYLYENLCPIMDAQGIATAVVTGSGDNRSTLKTPARLSKQVKISDLNTLLTLFSPISKSREKVFPEMTNEIDLLIGTDCISEGQNLQDCDFLINYDIHWNPVRIIQRFGRVDRLGSHNEKIQLVNFWPTKDLDEYINLQQRVQGRMVLTDVSGAGMENPIEADQKREQRDLEYRKQQLLSLQSTVVDLEDISGGISITDLTFSDFKADLMEGMKGNRKKLETAPHGMYAVATIPRGLSDMVKPGVIFTLRQTAGAQQSKEQNPHFPFYMAYVTEDGTVQMNFVHGRKILDIYKKVCKGQTEVLKDLVRQFNKETEDGQDMKRYTQLLQDAVDDLIGKKKEVGVMSLFQKGGTSQKNVSQGLDDFELISFLVLREE